MKREGFWITLCWILVSTLGVWASEPDPRPSTPEVEGGRDGDTVSFRVAGSAAPETVVWLDDTHERLDLSVPVDTNLALAHSDDTAVASPGDVLTYVLTATSLSPVAATGVLVEAETWCLFVIKLSDRVQLRDAGVPSC